jgi:hypothetical protein
MTERVNPTEGDETKSPASVQFIEPARHEKDDFEGADLDADETSADFTVEESNPKEG